MAQITLTKKPELIYVITWEETRANQKGWAECIYSCLTRKTFDAMIKELKIASGIRNVRGFYYEPREVQV